MPQRVGASVAPRGVRVVQAVALLLAASFVVTTLPGVRGSPVFHPLLDGWLQGTAYMMVAAVAVLRPVSTGVNRALWWLVAGGLTLRALGFALYLGYVRLLSPPPSPSVADAAWLASDVVLLVAVWVLLRVRLRQRSIGLALDALLVGLTVGGVAVELLFRTLAHIARHTDPDELVAVNLAYPLLDVAALVLVAGALLTFGWRSRSILLLTLGIAGDAVVDAVYVYQVSADTYHPGTLLAGLSVAASTAIAFAGWAQDSDRAATPRLGFSRVAVAAGLGLVSVAALVYGAVRQVPLGGILMPAGALVVGIGRGVFTVARNRGAAESAINATNAELLRFQALVEASDDFIAMTRPDGRVLYVNPAGRRLVGVEDRDVTEMWSADFLTEDGFRELTEVEQPALVSRGRWSGLATLLDHRGGPPIPVAVSSFLMRHPETGEPFAMATVRRDISERIAAQSALEQLADERQRLLDRLVQAQEDERARIAADVHDDSVQALAAVELRLGVLRRQLAGSDPTLLGSTDDLAGTVTEAIGRLRNLLFDLESPAAETDLASALAVAADHVFHEPVQWRVEGQTDIDLPPGLRVTAYRIAREAMVNVVKHAQASTVTIRLARRDGGVEVTVEDDGRGFDPSRIAPRPGHLGIPAMADRAMVAGGRLEVESAESGGTCVSIWLPAAAGDGPGGLT